jgi:hypothetical protein
MTPKNSKMYFFSSTLGNEKMATHVDTMEQLDKSVTLKSSNSLDLIMTAEGTVGEHTCSYGVSKFHI